MFEKESRKNLQAECVEALTETYLENTSELGGTWICHKLQWV